MRISNFLLAILVFGTFQVRGFKCSGHAPHESPSGCGHGCKCGHGGDDVEGIRPPREEPDPAAFRRTENIDVPVTKVADPTSETSKTKLVDKDLSVEEIKSLNQQGVKFVFNQSLYQQAEAITNYKVFLVYSNSVSDLKALYDIDEGQAQSLIASVSTTLQNSNIVPVADEVSLKLQLQQTRMDGTTPVVIFHNKGNSLFGTSLDTYRTDYGLNNIITCNSYNISQQTTMFSTDFLGIQQIIESAVESAPSPNLANYYTALSSNYVAKIEAQTWMRVTVVAGGSTAVVGGGVGVYYASKE